VSLNTFKKIHSLPVAAALAVFVLLAAGVHFIAETERRSREQSLRTQVARDLSDILVRLEAEINADVFLVNGLVAYIVAVRDIDARELGIALKTIHDIGRHVRNVGIAPDNRISQVYPLAGNEAAIGLAYEDDPAQWPAVERAIRCRCTLLAGPVALRQGGIGLISRTPVFLAGDRYWGMLSLVLDVQRLLQAVNIAGKKDGIFFSIRGVDGQGAAGAPFFGDPRLFATDSVRRRLEIPGGSWELAAKPVAGWQGATGRLILAEAIGLLLAGLMAALVGSLLANRQRVIISERRLRAILVTTQDGVVVIDEQGIILELNPAAERMFGYQAAELLGESVNRLMPARYASTHDRYLHTPRDSDQQPRRMGGRDVEGQRRDGSLFPLEITVGHTKVAERPLFVGLLRDITERKRAEERLVKLATTDTLTGIPNRRAFMETAERTFARSRRYNRPLSLQLLDADHFKRVNDTWGHQVGDLVLQRLCRRIQTVLRQSDCFARFGGEEFIVLMPETDREAALALAERLLATIRHSQIELDNGTLVSFTISIGCATLDATDGKLDDLIRRADQALYRAKSQGRDRCEEASPIETPANPVAG
jgi:diguanylate cyclase (GGDEF)-like protein/PAS domain S-box-containing protein